MKRYLVFLLAGVCFLGCQKKETPAPQPTNTTSYTEGGNPLTAPVDYLGTVAKAQKSAVRTIDTANLSQAIKAFQAGEDRNPASLNELVTQGYMPKLPEPPNGMKFDYNPQTGAIKVVPR